MPRRSPSGITKSSARAASANQTKHGPTPPPPLKSAAPPLGSLIRHASSVAPNKNPTLRSPGPSHSGYASLTASHRKTCLQPHSITRSANDQLRSVSCLVPPSLRTGATSTQHRPHLNRAGPTSPSLRPSASQQFPRLQTANRKAVIPSKAFLEANPKRTLRSSTRSTTTCVSSHSSTADDQPSLPAGQPLASLGPHHAERAAQTTPAVTHSPWQRQGGDDKVDPAQNSALLRSPKKPLKSISKRSRLPKRTTLTPFHAQIAAESTNSKTPNTTLTAPDIQSQASRQMRCQSTQSGGDLMTCASCVSCASQGLCDSLSGSIPLPNEELDTDYTPRKPAPYPIAGFKKTPDPSLNAKPRISRVADEVQQVLVVGKIPRQKIDITVSGASVREASPKARVTRSRSRHLLSQSGSGEEPRIDVEEPVAKLTKKRSRVLQMAQSFESVSPNISDQAESDPRPQQAKSTSSDSHQVDQGSTPPKDLGGACDTKLLGVTPLGRRHGPDPILSLTSSRSSTSSNALSPNLTALADRLSQQHVDRGSVRSGEQDVRSSGISDKFRLSTMSTLGRLRWEDGVGDVLLTDPHETQAMVADITLVETTPLKSETACSPCVDLLSARQTPQLDAAFLLTSARAGFRRGTIGRRSNDSAGARIEEEPEEEERVLLTSSRDQQVRLESPLVNMNARRSCSVRLSPSRPSKSSSFTLQQGESLAKAKGGAVNTNIQSPVVPRREEVEKLRVQLENSQKESESLRARLVSLSATKGQREVEEEQAKQMEQKDWLDELNRLESENNELREANVGLENELDQVKYENEEIKLKDAKMMEELVLLKSQRTKAPQAKPVGPEEKDVKRSSHSGGNGEAGVDAGLVGRLQSHYSLLIKSCVDEMDIVRSQLITLDVLKMGFNLHQRRQQHRQ